MSFPCISGNWHLLLFRNSLEIQLCISNFKSFLKERKVVRGYCGGGVEMRCANDWLLFDHKSYSTSIGHKPASTAMSIYVAELQITPSKGEHKLLSSSSSWHLCKQQHLMRHPLVSSNWTMPILSSLVLHKPPTLSTHAILEQRGLDRFFQGGALLSPQQKE